MPPIQYAQTKTNEQAVKDQLKDTEKVEKSEKTEKSANIQRIPSKAE